MAAQDMREGREEHIHFNYPKGAHRQEDKLEGKRGEGFFLGKYWRTGEAIVGLPKGSRSVEVQPGDLRVRFLMEGEEQLNTPIVHEEEKNIDRLQLRHEEVLTHSCKEKCPGCQSMLAGTSRQGHSEACGARMENAIRLSNGGQQRIDKQKDRKNEKLARNIEDNIENLHFKTSLRAFS